MSSLDHCGTQDLGLAVRLTYGYVLSPTTILSEAETSFVMIAGLVPQDVSFRRFFFFLLQNIGGGAPSNAGTRLLLNDGIGTVFVYVYTLYSSRGTRGIRVDRVVRHQSAASETMETHSRG